MPDDIKPALPTNVPALTQDQVLASSLETARTAWAVVSEELAEKRTALLQALQDLSQQRRVAAGLVRDMRGPLAELLAGTDDSTALVRQCLALLDIFAEDMGELEQDPDAVSAEDPGRTLLRLAETCQQAGNHDGALQALEAAGRLAASRGDRTMQANCAVSRATLLWEAGRNADALAVASEALSWAHQAGGLRDLEVTTQVGRLQHLTEHQEIAEGTLLSAFSQFQRWQSYYHAARAALFLADLYRAWRPDESPGWLQHALDLSKTYQLSQLFVWEWPVAGPLLAGLLASPQGSAWRDQTLSIFQEVGPDVARLWPAPDQIPADVRALPAVRAVLEVPGPAQEEAVGLATVLRIICLGDLAVYRGQDRIPDPAWQGRKTKSLFALLVQNRGRMISSDVLIETFWPDSSEERGRHNLYMAMYRLRRALEPKAGAKAASRYVLQHAESYGFNVDSPHLIDVDAFKARLQEGKQHLSQGDRPRGLAAFVEAERLYGGEYLQNDLYEEWCSEMRDELRRHYQDILTTIAKAHLEDRQPDMAETYVRKLILTDNSREDAHRLLMRILWVRGQRDEALKAYHTCCKILEEELAVRPLPETTELFVQIKSGQLPF